MISVICLSHNPAPPQSILCIPKHRLHQGLGAQRAAPLQPNCLRHQVRRVDQTPATHLSKMVRTRSWRLTAEMSGGRWKSAPRSEPSARATWADPPGGLECRRAMHTYSLPAWMWQGPFKACHPLAHTAPCMRPQNPPLLPVQSCLRRTPRLGAPDAVRGATMFVHCRRPVHARPPCKDKT